ncbi:hypothetical protein TcasGA2_TC004191 [Tribolium castaneum]|uniref:Uncharacterized protein n=1 Tax=Tribolium castaneum TaxID=7070 RepID=D7EJ51_TRICA|nr:hypothetical protein TcasGA2_TC004191 [Tribolium castaneum]
MDNKPITRLQLHNIMMEFSHNSLDIRKKQVLDFLKERFCTNGDEEAIEALVSFTRNSFFAPYFRNWQNVDRNNNRFLKKYDFWLREEIKFPDLALRAVPSTSCGASTSKARGSPSKDFEESSTVIKRRKTEILRKENLLQNYHLPPQ